MKTAISVPDATFERVEKKAAELGMNRSEFYATAAEAYLRYLEENDLTARMNAALARTGEAGRREDLEFAALASQHLARQLENDEW